MKTRWTASQLLALSLTAAFWVSPLNAQTTAQGHAQSNSKVSAELVKGKLNPATSKPGDQVTARTKEDVKSDGQVVLKKGTEITGVVKSVNRIDGKSDAKGKSGSSSAAGAPTAAQSSAQAAAQSAIQVEWLAPAGSGAASHNLNFALQSIAYTNPLHAHQVESESEAAGGGGIVASRPAPAPSQSRSGGAGVGGGLLGGVGATAGGAVSGATSTLGAAGNVGGAVTGGAGAIAGQGAASANAGLLPGASLPALIPSNSSTATSLQNNFGVSSNQLFMVGHGQAISSGGTATSMDIFSHMSNDAVITSPSKDFEIASGAQMDFMVSAKKE